MYIYDHTNPRRRQQLKEALKLITHVRDRVSIFDRRQLKNRIMASVDHVADRNVVTEIFMIFQCIAYFEHSKKMVKDMQDKVIGRLVKKHHLYGGDGEKSFSNFKIFIRTALTSFMGLYGGVSSHVPNVQHDWNFGLDVMSIVSDSERSDETSECRVNMFSDMYTPVITPCNVYTHPTRPCFIHNNLYKWAKARYIYLDSTEFKKTWRVRAQPSRDRKRKVIVFLMMFLEIFMSLLYAGYNDNLKPTWTLDNGPS